MLADSAEGNPFIYISNTVFTGVTHSSNLPLLQGAVTGIRVISVGTGHLRLLTQHDDRTQALSGRAGKHTNMQTLNHEITYRWFNQAQRNTFLILSKEGLKPLFTCFSSPPPISQHLSTNYDTSSLHFFPRRLLNPTCRSSGGTPSAGPPLQAAGPCSRSYSPQARG